MTLYELVLFLHILSAIVLIGGSIVATPAIRTAALRAETVAQLRSWLAFGHPFAVINPLTSMTLLASGLYLTAAGSWWNAAWVQAAIVLWVVNAVLAGFVVKPSIAVVAGNAFAVGDGLVGEDLDRLRRSRRWSVGSDVVLANDVGVLFLMVVKPGYAASVGAVAVLHLLLHGYRLLRVRLVHETSLRAGAPVSGPTA
jgi:uncharacterized membrane protein